MASSIWISDTDLAPSSCWMADRGYISWAMRHRRSFGAKKVCTDAGGDAGRRVVYGVAREMRVSGGGLDLRVTEKSGDHRQALAKRQSPRRPGVPEVVKPNIFERGACAYAAPLLAEVGDPRAGPGAGDNPRIARKTWYVPEYVHRSRRQSHCAGASLGIGEAQLA